MALAVIPKIHSFNHSIHLPKFSLSWVLHSILSIMPKWLVLMDAVGCLVSQDITILSIPQPLKDRNISRGVKAPLPPLVGTTALKRGEVIMSENWIRNVCRLNFQYQLIVDAALWLGGKYGTCEF